MLKRPATCGLAALVVVALASCTGSAVDDGSDPANPHQVEVLTSWATGNDELSFGKLVHIFEEAHPEIQLIDASVASRDGTEARTALDARFDAGNPPDSFLTHGGPDLISDTREGRVADVTSWSADRGLSDIFPTEVLELVTVDDRLVAVPVDIHRASTVCADTSLLLRAGIDPAAPPATMAGWISDLHTLQAAGVEYPLAVGGAWSRLQLFEAVLLADYGADRYDDLWSRPSAWKSDHLRVAIDHFGQLLQFADPAMGSQDLDSTVQTVVQSQAAYVVASDSAALPFENAGLTLGNQYTTFAAPGTDGAFDVVLDAFALSNDLAHREGAEQWLQVVASASGQSALAAARGSVPALLDPEADDLSDQQRRTTVAFFADQRVRSLSYGLAAGWEWTAAISAAVEKFAADPRAGALSNGLIRAADQQLG